MSTMWIYVSGSETFGGRASVRLPTVPDMVTTLLTRRRAVDHCRVRSSLCRQP
jgi:hypothetical protein